LESLELYSEAREELLIATAAQESHCGEYVRQVCGPALGMWMVEPVTYHNLWVNYIRAEKNQNLQELLLKSNGWWDDTPPKPNVTLNHHIPTAEELITNLRFAAQMAAIFYLNIERPLPTLKITRALPKVDDLNAIWEYYKKYYNTEAGAATESEFVSNYYKFAKKGNGGANAANRFVKKTV
jgi:hypothetical protein